MKYQFSMDKKAIAVFVCGVCLAGTLVFAGGFLVGLGVHLPTVVPAMIVKSTPPAAAVPVLVSAQKAAAEAAVPATAAATATPAPATPPATTVAAATAAPTNTAPADGAPANAAATAAAGAATAPAGVVAGGADTCIAAAIAPAPPAGSEQFALQLGSFLDPANALRLVANLKDRGCAASVSQITDLSNRAWTVVRIGPFNDLETATRAAADIRRTQGLLALVRPANSL